TSSSSIPGAWCSAAPRPRSSSTTPSSPSTSACFDTGRPLEQGTDRMPEQWNKYGATAARRHGRPGREVRPKGTTVHTHSPVATPRAGAFVKPHPDPATIALARFANAETKALSQKQEEDVRTRITGHDERLAELDTMGIDVQLVMPPPNQCYYTVPLEISVEA